MKQPYRNVSRNGYLKLKRLASRLNLRFSRWFAFGNKAIGLDPVNNALLISDENDNQDCSHLIELEKIRSISLKKSYGCIKAGELSNKAIGEFLKYARLQFDVINSNAPIILSLYERGKDTAKDLRQLDLNSKDLYRVLSKIVGGAKNLQVPASG